MSIIVIVIGIVLVIAIVIAIVIKNNVIKNNKNTDTDTKFFADFNLNEYFSAKEQMNMVSPRTYQNRNHVCVTWQDWNTSVWFVLIRMNASGRTFQYSNKSFDGHVATIAWATSQASKGLLAQ